MIYLASPYTHPDREVRLARYVAVRDFTAQRIREGYAIFSPIVHCHEIAMIHDFPVEFAFWQTYNEALLRQSLHLWVLCIDGWRESRGVLGEIGFAFTHDIPVYYVELPWSKSSIQQTSQTHVSSLPMSVNGSITD